MAEAFEAAYDAAVGDPQLGANLLTFQRGWAAGRNAAFESTPPPQPFPVLRALLAERKDAVIADQEAALARFTRAAQGAGAVVECVESATDAAQAVIRICREAGATLVVKTKSMVSEEIHLNHHLDAAGIGAVETDVGEWIIQLRGETPAHMVMPAIHLNRQQVAATVGTAVGHEVSGTDVAAQVGEVTSALRMPLLHARVGISGANALIATTGSAMIVTNEGNEALVTTLAEIHIVLVGADKLLETTADAMTQVRLLARSATGQRTTTYTTFVRGPAAPDRRLHYIVVDNGRSAMRNDPDFASALRCIRCAACASVCPPFQAVGGHVFGHIYSGAIGIVNTGFHHGLGAVAGPQALCVSCNACQAVCPVDIPLPAQILEVRRRVVAARGLPPWQRLVFLAWRNPRSFRLLARLAGLLTAPLRTRAGWLRVPLPRRHRWRCVPAPAMRQVRGRLRHSGTATTLRPRVAFLPQCITEVAAPRIALAGVRLLEASGFAVVVPRDLHCCGLPMLDAGAWDDARHHARRTIAALERAGTDAVVSTAPSCVAAMVHEYPRLFRDEPEWRVRAERLGTRVHDLPAFVRANAPRTDAVAAAVAPPPRSQSGTGAPPTVYHPFCQTRTVLGTDGAAREALAAAGVALVDLPEQDVCCGFGGSTSFTRPEVGQAIAARKLDCVKQSGADRLVSDNPGCVLHLRAAAAARGDGIHVAHIAEVLAEHL